MPPSKRRRTAAPAAAAKQNQQQTLSFRSTKAGPHTSELQEKPGTKPAAAKSSKPQVKDIELEDATDEIQTPDTTTIEDQDDSIVSAAEPEPEDEPEDEEATAKAAAHAALDKEALALSETKIKNYWAAKERERKAPRVHQEDLSVREKVLREWDMSSRYGPGIGITRLARWRRAHDLGMNPPIEVLAVLLKEQQVVAAGGSGKGKGKVEVDKSIMDELIMSSRIRGDTVLEA